MNQDEFELLVTEAVAAIPKFFKEKLDNVDIVIEDWPPEELSRGRLLLGLYQGIPAPARRNYSLALPDKISIFQGPILWLGRGDSERIKQIVTDTVEHEIAHHFGISDERLQEIKKKTI